MDQVGFVAPQVPELAMSTYVHGLDESVARVGSRTPKKRRNVVRRMLKNALCLGYC